MTKRNLKRHPVSGAPGIGVKKSAGAPALNPTGMANANPSLRKHNYLDPTVALKEIDHPSAAWAGIDLQPVKPREKFNQ